VSLSVNLREIMRFENFALASPYGATELEGLGHRWDLHSFAHFQGLRFDPLRNELTMEWQVPRGEKNPWGSPGNDALGCRLRFNGLRLSRAARRDEAYPLEESRTVSGLSKVTPEYGDFRFKHAWAPDDPFHLLVEFQDQREIEIAADAVRLESIP
jgi:hypothetical protein